MSDDAQEIRVKTANALREIRRKQNGKKVPEGYYVDYSGQEPVLRKEGERVGQEMKKRQEKAVNAQRQKQVAEEATKQASSDENKEKPPASTASTRKPTQSTTRAKKTTNKKTDQE